MMPATPLEFAFNYPRVLVAGHPSYIEYRITNRASLPLLDFRFTLHCPNLGLHDVKVDIGSVAPSESRIGHIDVEPRLPGAQPVRVGIDAAQGRTAVRMTGSCPRAITYERPDSPSNVSVIIKDIQSHRSEGDKGEFGSVKGDVNIHVTDLLPKVKTLNDLLQLQLPDNYTRVDLQQETVPGASEMLVIPDAFLHSFEPADVMHLEPDNPSESADSLQGWRLCSFAATPILGRSSMDSDVVIRFLPSSQHNDSKSATISRKHARLTVNIPDRSLAVESLAVHSAVRVNDAPLRAGTLSSIPEEHVIGIGDLPTDYRLKLRFKRPALSRRFRISNISEWIGNRITQNMDGDGDLGRIEFVPLNSELAAWQTIWFHHQISFGGDLASDMLTSVDFPKGVRGSFHHLRGCFWIECSDEVGGIKVNGSTLPEGSIVALREGLRLELGGRVFTARRVR
jgi:hypothetical protein